MREVILTGLSLPLQIYLQPRAFLQQVAALKPDLPRDYSLWRAPQVLRNLSFHLGFRRLAVRALVALAWGLFIPLVLLGFSSVLGYQVDWAEGMVNASFGVIVGAVLGGSSAALVRIAAGDAFGAVFGVAGGLALSIAFGAVLGMAGGVTLGTAGSLASGAAFGLAGGMVVGIAGGVLGGVIVGVAVSILLGAMFGAAFGVACGVAWALTATHIVNTPLEYSIGVLTWFLLRLVPDRAAWLWRCCPVCWDDVILPHLPGLTQLLVALYHNDPVQWQTARAKVAAHRYQHRAAYNAAIQLINDEARSATSAPAIASFRRELDWLIEGVPLSERVRDLVSAMRDVSDEVASALSSDSASNRVYRLEAATGALGSVRLLPGEFDQPLSSWSEIISTELEKARRQQRTEEPIPPVYVSGNPIQPPHRPKSTAPFKGRATLFRQLETALGSREGQRTTFLLHGQRRTGKTSVLLHLPQRLGTRIVPAFLDLQSGKLGGAQNATGLLGGLADEVVDQAQRYREIRLLPIDRKALIKDPYPAFHDWLDQVEGMLGECILLLCLDEFETLEAAIYDGRLDMRILHTLRHIVQHRQRIAVLLSGSHEMAELPAHWASALITTTTLSVSFLAEEDARNLIEEPVTGFPRIYAPAAVEHILHVTHCQPYLVQLICALLVERMNASRRVPPDSYVEVDDVTAVIPVALDRGQNYFLDLWRTQTDSKAARSVLEAMAGTPAQRTDSAKLAAVVSDPDALREAVNALLQREIIHRTDDGYCITVPLVAEYVHQHQTI